jgi:hypothetical protein
MADVERLLQHVNALLEEEETLRDRLPLTRENFAAGCQDGVIFW